MRTAAALLSSSRSVAGLADVVHAAGLATAPVDVDDATRIALRLESARYAALAAGTGSLRVLLLELNDAVSLREALQRLSRRLSSRAPHVLWLVAAVDSAGANAGIVGWSGGDGPRRVASFLWETDRIVDSDAETLCALAAVHADEDVLLHARCIEVLGRDALTRRFYRALQTQVGALADTVPAVVDRDDARGIALLYASRLLFLCFLEAKNWLNGDRAFIAGRFDDCMRSGGHFHGRVLLPLFFGTLNTPPARRALVARAFGRIPFLNGGLFTRTAQERRAGRWQFPDERLGALLEQLFQRFRFVAREDSATWSEASVDPEMLGRAFESLMASTQRRTSGVYYTPHELVSRVAEHALSAALVAPTLRQVRDLRVLDPACGSGAFLVYVLERLGDLRRELGETGPIAAIRRDVLARSVFGVDLNPTAVWLCELRLWLSVVIESDEQDPLRVPPLPNLDRNIRTGDALAGAAFSHEAGALVGSARVVELRRQYMRATGVRKQSLARTLDREERRRVVAQVDREIHSTQYARAELLVVQRARDLFGQRVPTSAESKRELKRLRELLRSSRKERRRIADGGALPFSFAAFFADAQARGGFDVVLGNPPWVRLHRIPVSLRVRFKESYEVYRSAPWQAGAASAGVAPGFASQVDLAALFVERSVALLRDGGVVSLLLPVKLWRSLAGGGLRQFLSRRTDVIRLEDLSQSAHAFDAAVYPSLLVARVGDANSNRLTVAVHDRTAQREWRLSAHDLPFDDSPGSPWILLTPDARASFDRVRAAGIPLSSSSFGAPRLGVKSGCNAAFVVRVKDAARELASIVDADGEEGSVELALLRPALRGDAVVPWDRSPCEEVILWTHDERGAPLARLPDRARAWLRRRYGELAGRSDAAHSRRWWSLFRVDAADTSTSRVVWADFGRRPRALVLPPGDPTVPLNTCYVVRCPDHGDARALAAILNSRLAAAWLNALAEPARGGYRRYLGWTVGQLPLPRDWTRARPILESAPHDNDERLLERVLSAYRLSQADVSALLEWRG
jgi:SAM-dependent methyltransferase